MPEIDLLFFALLLVVAFLYSSVGHGGASGYLALMTLYAFPVDIMRPAALVLNLLVSLIAFAEYYRGGYFRWNLFWPFAVASVPAAFLGGLSSIDTALYKKILGVLLLFSVIRLLVPGGSEKKQVKDPALWLSLIIGSIIGYLSGLIGIGGGIILSPVILIFHWADMKQTAAVSALFIFVNSLAGLAGLYTHLPGVSLQLWLIIGLAFTGGLAGSWTGAMKVQQHVLRKILALVLLLASFKLLFA